MHMCLLHGNVAAERQFSSMGEVLTKKRNLLHDETLDAILFIKSQITSVGGVENINVVPSLRVSCRNAHSKFLEAARLRQGEKIEKIEQQLTKSFSAALEHDKEMKTLIKNQSDALASVSEEKKKIDRKDRLIAELIAARDEDKESKVRESTQGKRNIGKAFRQPYTACFGRCHRIGCRKISALQR